MDNSLLKACSIAGNRAAALKMLSSLDGRILRAKVRSKDQNGLTPLHMAVAAIGDMELITRLIESGAEVNAAANREHTPLSVACESDNLPVLKLLIQHGARIDGKFGAGAAFIASQCGKISCLLHLLELGVDADSREHSADERRSCLMMAATNGHEHIVDALLRANASVNLQSATGTTALFFAAQSNRTGCLSRLLSAGALPNLAKINGGQTPLFIAAKNGQ